MSFSTISGPSLDLLPLGHRSTLPTLPPPRIGHALVFITRDDLGREEGKSECKSDYKEGDEPVSDQLITMGGARGTLSGSDVFYSNDVHASLDGGATWSSRPTAGVMWCPRMCFGCCVKRGVIFVVGGGAECTEASEIGSKPRLTYFNDVWMSGDGGVTWTMLVDDCSSNADLTDHFEARASFQLIATPDDELIVMGGTDGVDDFNDVWKSTDDGRTWDCVRGCSPGGMWNPVWGGRHDFWSTVSEGVIFVGGGCTLSFSRMDDVYASVDGGKKWIKVASHVNKGVGMVAVTAVAQDGNVFLFGGAPDNVLMSSVLQMDQDGEDRYLVAAMPGAETLKSKFKKNGVKFARHAGGDGEFGRYLGGGVLARDRIVLCGGGDGGVAIEERERLVVILRTQRS